MKADVACQSGVELLMDYLEGELPADVRADLEAHVSGCPRCVAFLESYRQTPRILRDAMTAAMPARLEDSLMSFLRQRRRSE